MSGDDPETTGTGCGTSGSGGTVDIARAWEEFAAGADITHGVRPEILASWYRCRDDYRVDPCLRSAPEVTMQPPHPVDQDVVLAHLSGIAATAANEIPFGEGIVTVTDGHGSIVGCWGPKSVRHRAADSNLAPWSDWSEPASGTNGMGTALRSGAPVIVNGTEHWCAGFHDWSCAGLAVRDLVMDSTIAAINISRWRDTLPEQAATWLSEAASSVSDTLRARAVADATALVNAFQNASHASKNQHALAALDLAGHAVAAGDTAAQLLDAPQTKPLIDPAERTGPLIAPLAEASQWAAERARSNPQWIGSVQMSLAGDALDATLRPVFAARRLVGLLCEIGRREGESYAAVAEHPPTPVPRRIIGVRNGRLVLINPSEIRYAEAERNAVWLTTDQGKIQADLRGLDTLARRLTGHGFLRVHRHYLVNLRRVREVERGSKGDLMLITDPGRPEFIPVARRHVHEVREALGL